MFGFTIAAKNVHTLHNNVHLPLHYTHLSFNGDDVLYAQIFASYDIKLYLKHVYIYFRTIIILH